MNLGIEGRGALVTGASAGLGLAAATALAADGARVVLVSRSDERLQRATTAIHAATGQPAEYVAADLTDLDAIPGLVAAARERIGPIDILVTNAGGPPAGTFDDSTRDRFDLAYRLTLMSSVELIRAALPEMKQRRWGRIAAITSTSVKQPIDGLLLSNVFRAGLTGFLKTLSREVGPFGITVNSVAPGYTETDRLVELGQRTAEARGESLEAVYAGWADATALRRLGEPDEIGAAIAWLCSERAAFVTGQVMVVDGGRSAGLL